MPRSDVPSLRGRARRGVETQVSEMTKLLVAVGALLSGGVLTALVLNGRSRAAGREVRAERGARRDPVATVAASGKRRSQRPRGPKRAGGRARRGTRPPRAAGAAFETRSASRLSRRYRSSFSRMACKFRWTMNVAKGRGPGTPPARGAKWMAPCGRISMRGHLACQKQHICRCSMALQKHLASRATRGHGRRDGGKFARGAGERLARPPDTARYVPRDFNK